MVEQEPSDAHPLLNARLSDGSRVSATLAPQSPDGDVMTIRRFGRRHSLDPLVAVGSVPPSVAALLRGAVLDQKNILIAGGTGTGKTTMVNALAETIPHAERIVIIESTSEIFLDKTDRNLVRFEARVAQSRADMEWPAIEVCELLRQALRFTPDRIIVGEVRGVEAWDLLQALNTGHQGSMSTIHANSAKEALVRLADCVIGPGGLSMPYLTLNHAIARSLDLVVQIGRNRQTGARRVLEVGAVDRYDAVNGFILTELFHRHNV
jgi:pilus assembly protein CpaF